MPPMSNGGSQGRGVNLGEMGFLPQWLQTKSQQQGFQLGQTQNDLMRQQVEGARIANEQASYLHNLAKGLSDAGIFQGGNATPVPGGDKQYFPQTGGGNGMLNYDALSHAGALGADVFEKLGMGRNHLGMAAVNEATAKQLSERMSQGGIATDLERVRAETERERAGTGREVVLTKSAKQQNRAFKTGQQTFEAERQKGQPTEQGAWNTMVGGEPGRTTQKEMNVGDVASRMYGQMSQNVMYGLPVDQESLRNFKGATSHYLHFPGDQQPPGVSREEQNRAMQDWVEYQKSVKAQQPSGSVAPIPAQGVAPMQQTRPPAYRDATWMTPSEVHPPESAPKNTPGATFTPYQDILRNRRPQQNPVSGALQFPQGGATNPRGGVGSIDTNDLQQIMLYLQKLGVGSKFNPGQNV